MSNDDGMTDAELARLEELCAASSPAPWRAYIEGRDHDGGSSIIQTGGADDIELTGAAAADYDFIAAARQEVPRLIKEIRRLRALDRSKEPALGP